MQTLLISAVTSLVSGSVYAYVGVKMASRPTSLRAKPAQLCFASWWAALATLSFVGAALQLLYTVNSLPLWVYEVFTQVALVVLVAALAALLYYLIFVYTGSLRAWILPVA